MFGVNFLSVIGDESASSVMGVMGKSAEITADLLKAFLGWLVGIRGRYIENDLKKHQMDQLAGQAKLQAAQSKLFGQQERMLKNMNDTMDAKAAVQEGRGLVEAQKLYKSGEPLTAGATALNPQQQKDFARHAKNYGLTYTLIKNDSDPSGRKIMMFAQKDLQKVKDITDRMTEDAQIKEIKRRIDQLKAKGAENFTKQDYQDLANLEDLRDGKISAPIEALNKAGNEKTFEEISGELKEQQKLGTEPLTFDRALNHITDRDWYVSDEPYYVVERTNPNNYIELNSKREKDHIGRDYTKTYYGVYVNGEKAGNWDDGRFDGRPPGYWQDVKKSMQSAGQFTDDVVIFRTKGEFDQYVASYNKSVEQAQTQNLGESLYDVGCYFNDAVGEAIDYNSDEQVGELLKNGGLNGDERLRLSKAAVIADQTKIAMNLDILDNEEARINYLLERTAPAPRDAFMLQRRLDAVNEARDQYKALSVEKALLREKLCSVEALKEVTDNSRVQKINWAKRQGLDNWEKHDARIVETSAVQDRLDKLSDKRTDWRANVNSARQFNNADAQPGSMGARVKTGRGQPEL